MLYLIIGWVGCGALFAYLALRGNERLSVRDVIITFEALLLGPLFWVAAGIAYLSKRIEASDKIIIWEKKR